MRKISLAALAATAIVALAAPASATDFSFVGTLANDDQVLFFDFAVGAASTVTLRTWSYAGGTNAAGAIIARGGFDPILSLYDIGTGLRVAQNDDGGSFVAADSVSGARFDTYLTSLLNPGNYRVAITEFNNFGPTTLAGVFPGSQLTNFGGRDGHWAFDVLNVNSAVQLGVPEPGTWALMILGFGGVGAMVRSRRRLTALTA